MPLRLEELIDGGLQYVIGSVHVPESTLTRLQLLDALLDDADG
ncbi:hypothetical protein RAB80_017196 [Fusarium oxysporum f. sp. vasinfectum]|nr:hypothetical protein RAB80_017271 [Fusarium oxysporum f. sp. vasinfectum]KAK2668005.1 hypothetical protein RAB80_017196 [Fusarium oxysporum f. sp. vasinfectum]